MSPPSDNPDRSGVQDAAAASNSGGESPLGVVRLARWSGVSVEGRGFPSIPPGGLLVSVAAACFFTALHATGHSWLDFAVRCGGAIYGLLLVLVLVQWVRERKERRRFAQALRGVPSKPDDSARLWCCGSASNLAEMTRLGPITDSAFEPRVFQSWKLTGRAAVGVGVSLGLALYLATAFTLSVWIHRNALILSMPMFHAGLVLVAGCYKPRYTRITPRKVEFVESTTWGRELVVRRTVELAGARVIADVDQDAAIVTSPDGGEVVIHVHNSTIELLHTLLEAAASTASVPDVPPGTLVG